MPARNIVKTYVENGYYHIYNRGVEKRKIFLDEQDCTVFLHYIKLYLLPKDKIQELTDKKLMIRFIKQNLSEEIDLLSFTLMPNHFHLLVKQYTQDGIIKFMRRLTTSYVMYFNKKYRRIGSLFQSTYKASLVENDEYLLHLSRYIHLNPINMEKSAINFVNFSSYPYYLENRHALWIKPQEILEYFGKRHTDSYKKFIEETMENPHSLLKELTLEE